MSIINSAVDRDHSYSDNDDVVNDDDDDSTVVNIIATASASTTASTLSALEAAVMPKRRQHMKTFKDILFVTRILCAKWKWHYKRYYDRHNVQRTLNEKMGHQ